MKKFHCLYLVSDKEYLYCYNIFFPACKIINYSEQMLETIPKNECSSRCRERNSVGGKCDAFDSTFNYCFCEGETPDYIKNKIERALAKKRD